MQAIYKRASVLIGFVILVAVVAVNSWFINRQLGYQDADHTLLVHTQEVLLELTQTGLLLDDAETGQRGFLYTGSAAYLEPYNLAALQLDRHIQAIKQLTADNPRQQKILSQLSADAHTKLDELRETISLFREGNAQAARDLVLSGQGKALMDRIRESISQMEREESAFETQRAKAYSKGARITRISIFLAAAITVLGLALLAYYVLREMALRERYALWLREGEEWYRVTLTSIGDGVIATNPDGNVTFLNPVAEQLTGHSLSKTKGKPITEIFPIFNEQTQEPVENPIAKVIGHGKVVGLANHTILKRTDGALIPIEDSAAPIHDDRGTLIGVVLVFRDATAEKEAQEIVRKAEKLAAASRLAATVAHEINNPLDAMGNLVYLARSVPGTPPPAVEYLTLAEEQLDRVAHITRQTLAFYRESKKWVTVDLIGLVESALNLYSNKLNAKQIMVERDYGECPALHGSPGELKQVIANLISNAADAVEVGGSVKVRVSSCSLADHEGVQLRIEDDGSGIANENLARIFEPFFTTKEDVGTGLGLWVAKEIVERHGGTIQADSGRADGLPGAAFTVCIPLTLREAALAADNISRS